MNSAWLKKITLSEIFSKGSQAFFVKGFGIIFSFLLSFIISRYYGKEATGNYTISLMIINLSSLFGKFGLDSASLKYVSIYNSRGQISDIKSTINVIFKYLILFSSISAFLVWIFRDNISEDFFSNRFSSDYITYSALAIVPFCFINVTSEIHKAFRNFKIAIFLKEVAIYLFAIIILICFQIGYDEILNTPVILLISIFCVFLFTIITLPREFLSELFTGGEVYRDFKEKRNSILRYSYTMLTVNSIDVISQYGSIIIISFFMTASDVGIWFIIQKISSILTIPLMSIEAIVAPKFAELYVVRNVQEIKKNFKNSLFLSTIVTLPLALILIVFNKMILSFFGHGFEVGSTALLIIVMGRLINAFTGPVGIFLQMTGSERSMRNIIACTTLINIFLGFLLVPKFGILGCAISTATYAISTNLALFFKVYKEITYMERGCSNKL